MVSVRRDTVLSIVLVGAGLAAVAVALGANPLGTAGGLIGGAVDWAIGGLVGGAMWAGGGLSGAVSWILGGLGWLVSIPIGLVMGVVGWVAGHLGLLGALAALAVALATGPPVVVVLVLAVGLFSVGDLVGPIDVLGDDLALLADAMGVAFATAASLVLLGVV